MSSITSSTLLRLSNPQAVPSQRSGKKKDSVDFTPKLRLVVGVSLDTFKVNFEVVGLTLKRSCQSPGSCLAPSEGYTSLGIGDC